MDLNETEGFSLIYAARNGKFIGWLGLQDQTRADEPDPAAAAPIGGDASPLALSNGASSFTAVIAAVRSPTPIFSRPEIPPREPNRAETSRSPSWCPRIAQSLSRG